MKSPVKPRWLSLLGWAALTLVGLFGAQILSQRPSGWVGGGSPTPASRPAGPDGVEQALKSLAEVKASAWRQGIQAPGDGGHSVIALAPQASEVAEAGTNPDEPADPRLKGAVVVRSGQHEYLVLDAKRFRVGDRIDTGEVIRALSLQSVRLVSPEGRARHVDIGHDIGSTALPFTW